MKHFIFCLLFICSQSWSDSSSFTSSFTLRPKEEVPLEDYLRLDLILTYPTNYHPDIEKITENLLSNEAFGEFPFSLKSRKNRSIYEINGLYYHTLYFKLFPEITGTYDLSFYNIIFLPNDVNGEIVEIVSDIQSIKIASHLIKTNTFGTSAPLLTTDPNIPVEMDLETRFELLNNEDALNTEFKKNKNILSKKTFPWFEILALTLMSLGAWIWYKSSFKPLKEPQILPQTATEQALESLGKLERKNLDKHEMYGQFYLELTTIVRVYLQKKYRIKVIQSTTEEFLEETSKNPVFSYQLRSGLVEFLTFADRVKFSGFNPSIDDCQQALKSAKEFVSS